MSSSSIITSGSPPLASLQTILTEAEKVFHDTHELNKQVESLGRIAFTLSPISLSLSTNPLEVLSHNISTHVHHHGNKNTSHPANYTFIDLSLDYPIADTSILHDELHHHYQHDRSSLLDQPLNTTSSDHVLFHERERYMIRSRDTAHDRGHDEIVNDDFKSLAKDVQYINHSEQPAVKVGTGTMMQSEAIHSTGRNVRDADGITSEAYEWQMEQSLLPLSIHASKHIHRRQLLHESFHVWYKYYTAVHDHHIKSNNAATYIQLYMRRYFAYHYHYPRLQQAIEYNHHHLLLCGFHCWYYNAVKKQRWRSRSERLVKTRKRRNESRRMNGDSDNESESERYEYAYASVIHPRIGQSFPRWEIESIEGHHVMAERYYHRRLINSVLGKWWIYMYRITHNKAERRAENYDKSKAQ